jgi:hypothetical protein
MYPDKKVRHGTFFRGAVCAAAAFILLAAVFFAGVSGSSGVSYADGSPSRAGGLTSSVTVAGTACNSEAYGSLYKTATETSVSAYTSTDFSGMNTQTTSGTFDYIATKDDDSVDTSRLYTLAASAGYCVYGENGKMLLLNNEGNTFNGGNYSVGDGGDDATSIFLTSDPGDVDFAFTFGFSDELRKILKDKMLTVTAKPYIVVQDKTGSIGDTSSADGVYIGLDYYTNNKVYSGTNNKITLVLNRNIIVEPNSSAKLASGDYSADSFMQISLRNWSANDSFGAMIAEIGIKITVTPNAAMVISNTESTYSVQGTDRNALCSADYAALYNTVAYNLVFYCGTQKLVLDTGAYTADEPSIASVADGTMFRRIFLDGDKQGEGGEDEYIITWSVEKGAASSVLGDNKSGQAIDFSVESSDSRTGTLVLVAAIKYRKPSSPTSKVVLGTGFTFTINVDTISPNAPELGENSFYDKYITDCTFFTKAAAQSDFDDNGNPVQIDLAYAETTSDTRPAFSANATDLKGGSSEIIYYKTAYVGDEIPTVGEDKASTGFYPFVDASTLSKNISIGLYCTIEEGLDPVYSDLYVNLFDADDARIQSGVWSVEFITYDYVGNSAYCSQKYFVRVDITDYEFNMQYILGEDANDDSLGIIDSSVVTVSYAAVSDAGKVSTKFSALSDDGTASFRRGDRILIQVKYTSTTYYNKYFLTYFSTKGVSFDCRSQTYTNNATKIESLSSEYGDGESAVTANYTFEVGDVYCKSPSLRYLAFKFKLKVSIKVTNTEQFFDGASKTVNTQVVNGNDTIGAVKVTTYYYTDDKLSSKVDIGGSNQPLNAGTYYYYSEILNNNYYYGKATGSMIIKRATPDISTIGANLEINYGQSLADIDFDYSLPTSEQPTQLPGEDIYALFNGAVTFSLSADGVIGYYSFAMDRTLASYVKPQAGKMTVTVKFTPVKGTRVGSAVTYSYTSGGCFIVDDNYNVVTRDITVTVNNDTSVKFALDAVQENGSGSVNDGVVCYTYTGAARTVYYTAVSSRTDESGLDLSPYCSVEYAAANTLSDKPSDLSYGYTVPISAGIYCVRITVNENLCNYSGVQYWFMSIGKITLSVAVSQKTCEYQYEEAPAVTAMKGTASFTDKVRFSYSYYYYPEGTTLTLSEAAEADNLVSAADTRTLTGVPVTAGRYAVKCEVSDTNYGGAGYGMLTIKKVAEGNTYFSVNWPGIDNSSVSPECHICYGQPLSEIKLGSVFAVKYTYITYITATKKTASTKTVAGSVKIVTEDYSAWKTEQAAAGKTEAELTKDAYLSYMANDTAESYRESSYAWKLCFVPDDGVDFDFLYGNITGGIKVGKASLDWANVKIDDIAYETPVSSSSDLVISNTVGRLYSTKGATPQGADTGDYYVKTNNYVYVYITSGYTYSLSLAAATYYSAGTTNVDVTLTPSDSGNYNASYVNSCSLTVLKKTLAVTFGGGGYSAVYGKFDETALYGNITYSGNALALPYMSGIFSYTDAGGTVYKESELKAGAYTAVYTLDNENYRGAVSFAVTIEKSKLSVSEKPKIANVENVVYYKNSASGVTFYNGKMEAEGGETVTGAFTLAVSQKNLVFGDSGSEVTLYFVFTPTDMTDYVIFSGIGDNGGYVTVTVGKADVSGYMSLDVNGSYTYGSITYSADAETLKTYFIGNGYATYALSASSGAQNLAWKLSAATSAGNTPAAGYLNAGTYRLTASIDTAEEPNYTGSVSTVFAVAKKQAYIVLAEDASADCDYITYDTLYGVKKPYAGKSLSVGTAVYDADGKFIPTESVSAVYKHDDVTLASIPSSIGYYDCYLSLKNSVNYTLVDKDTRQALSEVHTFLMISADLSEIELTNLTQTYTIQKTVIISLGLNEAECVISYEDKSGAVYSDLPVNAGTYEIYLTFDPLVNNGYSDVIKASDIKSSYVLVIGKYPASIVASSSISTTYTGKESETVGAYTNPYGLTLAYAYSADGATFTGVAGVSALGALDAGAYKLKITVDDSNYSGEKTIDYTVVPAAVFISAEPAFENYTYNTDDAPAVASEGKVYCRSDGNNDVDGTFSINPNAVNTLNAGAHTVQYTFTPSSANYSSATGTVNLVITKRVLDGSFLYISAVDGSDARAPYLENADFALEYDTTYHTASVSYDSGKLFDYDGSNNDFTVSLTYNGSIVKPRGKGTYTVSATVASKNYVCSRTWNYKIEITKCTPSIDTAPTVSRTFILGSTITASDISGGRAVIKATGAAVNGVFGVVETTFSKANANKVTVTFTPDDTDLFETLTDYKITVNVIGKDPFTINGVEKAGGTTASGTDWTDKDAATKATSYIISPVFEGTLDLSCGGGESFALLSTHDGDCGAVIRIYPVNGAASLYYGATLSQFALSFECAHEGCEGCQSIVDSLNECGTLEFVDGLSYVPDVGESVRVIYKLNSGKVTEYESYNNMTGLISLDGILEKVALSTENASFGLIAFDTEMPALTDGCVLGVNYGDGLLASFDYRNGGLVIGGAITATDTSSDVSVSFDASAYASTGKITVEISTRNYYGAAAVEPDFYTEVESEDIIAANDTKVYDGKGISAADMGLSAANTQLTVGADAYSVKVYDSEGSETDGVSTGVYTVMIYLKDDENRYFGTKTILFTVTQRDISEELALVKTSDTYGSETVNSLAVKWGETVMSVSSYSLLYKLAGAPDSAYVKNIAFDAGSYDVKITVAANASYAGTAVRRYVVNPKSVTLKTAQTSYVFVYGGTVSAPEVSFTDTISGTALSLEYTVYYFGENYTKSVTVPVNAGAYTVSVELADANYALVKNVFSYTISKKGVSVNASPTALFNSDGNNLKYGQKLSELVLNGGYVTSDDAEVRGSFRIAASDADKILHAGTQTVTVVFTPDDVNYATATAEITVTVGKATATVTFTNLSAYYTGATRKNEIKYTVAPSINIYIEYQGATGDPSADPVAAGNYSLIVTTDNTDYDVAVNETQSGGQPVFAVYKARVRNVSVPAAASVAVGESLTKSALSPRRGVLRRIFKRRRRRVFVRSVVAGVRNGGDKDRAV